MSAYGRTFFSHKQLFKKNGAEIMEMLSEIGKPWKELPYWARYGNLYVQSSETYFDDACGGCRSIRFVPKSIEFPLSKDPTTLDCYFKKESVSATREEFRKLKSLKKKNQKVV